MHSPLHAFSRAFQASRQGLPFSQVRRRPHIAQFICRSCQHKYSTTSFLRKIIQTSRRTLTTAAKNVKEKKYPENLVIYDAGPSRTTFVSTWKAIAFLQFGTCCVFITPTLYNNENQPNKSIRVLQAAGVTLLATVPSAILSFVTAPYVKQIMLHPIPPAARHSLTALRAFARNLPSTTKITFQTLRIFPIPKHTTAYVNELCALPPRKFRFANIELPKSDAWRQRQKEKGFRTRFWEFISEPRFKFYAKESRVFTMRPGVPGVWEEVARRIQQQTEESVIKETKADQKRIAKSGVKAFSKASSGSAPVAGKVQGLGTGQPPAVKVPSIRRQTSRRPPPSR